MHNILLNANQRMFNAIYVGFLIKPDISILYFSIRVESTIQYEMAPEVLTRGTCN